MPNAMRPRTMNKTMIMTAMTSFSFMVSEFFGPLRQTRRTLASKKDGNRRALVMSEQGEQDRL